MKIDPNGPAYPTRSPFICAVHPDGGMRHINTAEYGMGPEPGLTVRAEFAKCIMAALMTESVTFDSREHRDRLIAIQAEMACAAADALIAELNKEPGQ